MRRQAISGVVLTILSLTLLALNPHPSSAEIPLPREDYRVETPDKEYVFIMLIPTVGAQQYDKIDAEMRKNYTASGLYKNNGSTDPLWTVGWWSYDSSIHLSSDGKHLVRVDFSDVNAYSDNITFYENGYKLKSYTLTDLISNPVNLPTPSVYGSDNFSWLASEKFEDAKNRFTIHTNFGDEYRFDIRNGNILSNFDPFDFNFDFVSKIPLPVLVMSGLILISLAGFGIDFIVTFRKGKRT